MVPLAHFGHVLIDLPIFFGPVAGLSGWLLFITRRERRRERRERQGGPDGGRGSRDGGHGPPAGARG